MIRLSEIAHNINTKDKDDFINVDNWRFPDVQHLVDMGFEITDDHHLTLDREPFMSIYKKNDIDEKTKKPVPFFHLEEPKKEVKRFKDINDLIDYFSTYSQPSLDND